MNLSVIKSDKITEEIQTIPNSLFILKLTNREQIKKIKIRGSPGFTWIIRVSGPITVSLFVSILNQAVFLKGMYSCFSILKQEVEITF